MRRSLSSWTLSALFIHLGPQVRLRPPHAQNSSTKPKEEKALKDRCNNNQERTRAARGHAWSLV